MTLAERDLLLLVARTVARLLFSRYVDGEKTQQEILDLVMRIERAE